MRGLLWWISAVLVIGLWVTEGVLVIVLFAAAGASNRSITPAAIVIPQ